MLITGWWQLLNPDEFISKKYRRQVIGTELVPDLGKMSEARLFKLLAAFTLWMRRFLGFGETLGEPDCTEHSADRLTREKTEFLKDFGSEYGYPDGPVSIDQLRFKEFPRLQDMVYVDHAGATLYTVTQLKGALNDLSTNVYGNPHSQSASSLLSSDVIERTRNQVLALCKASPEEYACVFTSGATGALKLVGETFPWGDKSQFMYTMENHNSVLGIREYALNRGATVTPVYLDHKRAKANGGSSAPKFDVRLQSAQRRTRAKAQDESNPEAEGCSLFAFPLECNFSGAKFDLGVISFVQQAQHVNSKREKWFVLLDAAKGCSTAPPDLSRFSADFVAISFYKIFGYPTGLGALLVRKDAAAMMTQEYFSGGTVAMATADADIVERRPRLEERLEDGTVSFLGIAALSHGFDVINQLRMSAINRHTGSLARYTASKLDSLRHGNEAKVCVLYGNHETLGKQNVKYWGSHCEQGPIVCFNLKRANGSWVGYREVEKLATLSSIHLRTGCFCNPGACLRYVGISKDEMKQNFEAGHVCWDDKDLINGYPTGAVRVSFGYMNTFDDCWAFLQFISEFFLEHTPLVYANQREDNQIPLNTPSLVSTTARPADEEPVCSLQSITVYPIKSCGGFSSKAWPLGDSGLLYDREWLIMSMSGEILTQKKCPMMCFIQTYVDLEFERLSVQAPNMKNGLSIPLMEAPACKASKDVELYSKLVGSDESESQYNEWFTEALGIPCKLIRKKQPSRGAGGEEVNQRSFANEGQLLLVSLGSLDDLNCRLSSTGSKLDEQSQASTSRQSSLQVDVARFRPNFAVSGSLPYDEDNWQTVVIGDQPFQVTGGCNRCKMINIDQETGATLREPLITLASYRRVKGMIYFGVLLEQDTTTLNSSYDNEKNKFNLDQSTLGRHTVAMNSAQHSEQLKRTAGHAVGEHRLASLNSFSDPEERKPIFEQSPYGSPLRRGSWRVVEVGQRLRVTRKTANANKNSEGGGQACLWQREPILS